MGIKLGIFNECLKEYDMESLKQFADLDTPIGYKEPRVYRTTSDVKTTNLPALVCILAFLLGYLVISLKFNDVNFRQIPICILILLLPATALHELVHGGACYLLTKPHCFPRFCIKRAAFHIFCIKHIVIPYTYLPPKVYLTKYQAI